MGLSLLDRLALLPREERERYIERLTSGQVNELAKKPWWLVGRPEQQPPAGNWHIWLIMSGRGWGKTRTGAEWLWQKIQDNPTAPDGRPTEWAIVAPTFGLARDVCVEGPSGLLQVVDRDKMRYWNRSLGTMLFHNGVKVHSFGADNRDAGRGKNLAGAWLDEFAMWPYPTETWTEGLAPALRIGDLPQTVITTTPKPIKMLREWTARDDGTVAITRGSTFDNSRNLSASALTELRARYEGTKMGRQELFGELLEDVEGALWTWHMIEEARIPTGEYPPFARVVVAIDPAVTSGEESDETGISVAGVTPDGHFYILADASCRVSPDAWARVAVNLYHEYQADRIIGETNNGGDMIGLLLRQVDPTVSYKKVTATRGKRLRAEPISALYEQGRVHHVGTFPKLEEQMVTWTPDSSGSPDRLDALVWALTELSASASSMMSLAAMANFCSKCRMPAAKSATICPSCGNPLGG